MDIDAARIKEVMEYYLRPEIIDRIFALCEGREVIPVFRGNQFGRRPASAQFRGDIEYLVRKGATSFHCSLEHWSNPLLLSNNMNKKDMDDIRTGWDIFFDIDANEDLEHGRIAAKLMVEALAAHGVHNVSLKFSGRRGFHIGVSCKSLPEKVNFLPIEVQYPLLLQKIADYLRDYIRKGLVEALVNYDESLKSRMNGDPYSILEVEHNWSFRHLFRMPYSFNEKTWLVSLPIEIDKLDRFKVEDAKPENVRGDLGFMDGFKENEALDLVMEALDYDVDEKKKETKRDKRREKMISSIRIRGTIVRDTKNKIEKDGSITKEECGKSSLEYTDIRELIKEVEKLKVDIKYGIADKIPEEFFPPCINNIFKGLNDGRKRALFILINFLRCVGWEWKDIEERLKEWNEKNPEPLPDSYLRGQVNHAKKATEIIPPPNCENEGYYKDILICTPDNLCPKYKNPVNYALVKSKSIKKKR